MNLDKKLLQARAANLLREYEPMLRQIIEDETAKLSASASLKSTIDEIAIDATFRAGVREGMNRVLSKLNEYSR